jgi:hypothetical protein
MKLLFIGVLALVLSSKTGVVEENLSLPVSKESLDMIVQFEVGGRSYYEAKLQRPTVPSWQTTSSGVTVGFGFDLGYNTPEQIEKAFKGVLSDKEIEAMKSVAGLKGKRAYYEGLPKVKNVVRVSYEDAEKVFIRDSLPRFTKQTADAFKLSKDRLNPHCNGALTSLVFNRGPSTANTDSRKEMRDIRYHISVNKEESVPTDLRNMKRLWSYTKLKGLHLRRDAEAKMFQKGLDSN